MGIVLASECGTGYRGTSYAGVLFVWLGNPFFFFPLFPLPFLFRRMGYWYRHYTGTSIFSSSFSFFFHFFFIAARYYCPQFSVDVNVQLAWLIPPDMYKQTLALQTYPTRSLAEDLSRSLSLSIDILIGDGFVVKNALDSFLIPDVKCALSRLSSSSTAPMKLGP